MTDPAKQEPASNYLDLHADELLAFSADLISTPSINPPGDERLIAAMLRDRIVALGMPEPRFLSRAPDRPNLLLALDAGPGPTLLLVGHTDTKPIGDLTKWSTDPLRPDVRDGRLYGLGACDMKGAVAAMIYAAAALSTAQERWHGRLLLALCADEEAGGSFGAAYLASDGAVTADVGLVAEPAGVNERWEYLYTGSRGECCFRIRVRGTQMHSSISDRVPSINANVRAAELLSRMASQLKFRTSSRYGADITFTPGVLMQGGVYFGILPPVAEFACEVRVPPGMTRREVGEQVEEFLVDERRRDDTLFVTWSFEQGPLGWIAPHTVPRDHALVSALQNAARSVLGREPPAGTFPAWTDARFFDAIGIPCLPAFGPGRLTEAHRPNEFVEARDILAASQIYSRAALAYLGADSADLRGYLDR